MSDNEIARVNRYEKMNEVMEMFMTGVSNPTKIAAKLGMKRADVVVFINEWKATIANNTDLQAKARETVVASTQHYDKILEHLWNAAKEAEDNGDYKAHAVALKTIADVDAKRIEFLQKAGLYDDAHMGDKLAEVEEQVAAIKKLLQKVAREHPETKNMLTHELAMIFNQPVAVPVEDDDNIVDA